jgi:hypothetical protein
VPYIDPVLTSYENIWRHFTDSKSCQIIESILKYKNGVQNNFQIVFTFDVFFSAETTCTAKWHVFYIRNGHISVSSFIYKYDQWPHDRKSRCLRGRRHSHCVKLWKDLIESYRHGMCFRIIHFILISSARVIFDVSSGLALLDFFQATL